MSWLEGIQVGPGHAVKSRSQACGCDVARNSPVGSQVHILHMRATCFLSHLNWKDSDPPLHYPQCSVGAPPCRVSLAPHIKAVFLMGLEGSGSCVPWPLPGCCGPAVPSAPRGEAAGRGSCDACPPRTADPRGHPSGEDSQPYVTLRSCDLPRLEMMNTCNSTAGSQRPQRDGKYCNSKPTHFPSAASKGCFRSPRNSLASLDSIATWGFG